MPMLMAMAAIILMERSFGTGDLPGGWYYAGSKVMDEKAIGGFGPCNNFPKKCPEEFPGPEGKLSLIAFPDEIIEFGRFQALPLRLVNRTGETVGFLACDSRLYIVQEALMEDGQWRALERFPETFCGNSFHRVFLESNEYWEFFAPHRHGWHQAKLRFRLEPKGEQGGGTLVSNEYEGTIEPGALRGND
jgi:hypothetical protein